ncbi:ABC transporter G family member 21 [Sphaceloma murrayae]|uniref:ABC transporter G family member 21 n=1 Tax=Sphaceloma murrayae TaxID=2082308 RepID=A0A2K1QMS8_9PEZI|nr:ABC transporter G family member 21 [Sphaceloma murrayae]
MSEKDQSPLPTASSDTNKIATSEPSETIHGSTTNTSSQYSADDEKTARPSTFEPIHHPALQRVSTGVDVKTGEEEFAQLGRQLSSLSQSSRRRSQQASRRASKVGGVAADVEKAAVDSTSSDDGEPFDLQSYLRNSKAMEDEAGIKEKQIGVLWDGLTVKGYGGFRIFTPTFPDAVVGFFNVYQTLKGWLGMQSPGPTVEILKGFKGLVEPGEMVLVLGKPGSGCTSFLKVITNQRYGYTDVEGEVLYGPFDAETFENRYRGEAVYCQEDDVHHATLTVGQTLKFALETKVPGKRPAGLSANEMRDRVSDMLLRMFNIEHTKNTVVGDANVRGVSGGERKRVSIAEAMVTGAAVYSYDNSTRGLDASTALDYAKSLRMLTNIYKTTTFVSLYQASENIYDQFDKVMVIDEGRQVFFGPTKAARAYFEGLGFMEKPRQTTPDYLTGCTDPFEREYADGRDESNVPSTPDALVQAFNDSEFAKQLDSDMSTWRQRIKEEQQVADDFQTAVTEAKRKASAKSVYSVPFYLQVWALMKRQFTLKWQDRFSLVVSWITSIVIAIVLGTVWFKVPATTAGAFIRGGLLFISLLFNAFTAFGELGSTMLGRPIVNKHRAYAFHRPSALWVAQIGVDIFFASAQIFVFGIIVYFMCGLVLSAGAFFTFVLLIISAYLAMTLFFRTVGCLCPDFDYAIKFAAFIITLLVLTSGYLIQWAQSQVWLRWIYYINPLGLGFSALMENEFGRLDMTCTAESLIPSGPGYTNINNQVCTLGGSTAGSLDVPGGAYIQTTFNYAVGDLWRNFGIVIALTLFFLSTNVYLGEYVRWGAGGRTITLFTKESQEEKKLNAALAEKREKRKTNKAERTTTMVQIESKAVLTWEKLCYDVPVSGGTRRLLNDVYGYVKPGQLTALMGASGAGKTTLLDVLASRKNIGVIHGDVLVDGKQPGKSFQRGTAYAEQQDQHEATQTVREALRFSANLRQPFHVPQEEKYAYVEEIISLLEMEEIADAIIGWPASGLAVEQRKRVTIGVELAAKPELLLFLDEPTSGLDSQSAFNIVRFLRKLSAAGQAILCTIHQPNASVFDNFDRLLLLQRGGQTVYFGDIGKDASHLRSYFSKYGAECPPDANPAEWMLDAIGAGQAPRIGDRDWADIWKTSSELQQIQDDIVALKAERSSLPNTVGEQEFATPLWYQIRIVNWRTQLAFWRSPNYGFTRLFNHVVIALLTGLMFLQLGDSRASLQNRVFVIFQTVVLPALILAQVEPKYDMSRIIYYREAASKSYKQFAFAISMILAEMPYSVLCAVGFFLPLYYMPGFQSASSRAGYQFFMILITEVFSVTLGQLVSALTPSTYIAVLLNPFMLIIFALFCGVTIPVGQMPEGWRWLYQLNPLTRLVGGMIVTELNGRSVTCESGELNRFAAPSGQTCGEYTQAFFENGGLGYIVDNATSMCEYCAYKIGDQFYEPLGYEFGNRWRDLGIMIAFVASNILILFIGGRYLNFNRR